jgi:hypothetical protein
MSAFKLSEEMIKEIEDKVNKALDEEVGKKSDLPVGSFTTICWIILDLTSDEIQVIEPVEIYPEDDEYDFEGIGDIEYDTP